MQDIVFRREVLKLNKLHLPVGFATPKKVFIALANYLVDGRKEYILDKRGKPIRKMLAYDIDYKQNQDGTYDFTKPTVFRLVDWAEWITLPIRSFDLMVHTPNFDVRIPRVVMSLMYEDMPETKHNTSLNSIYELYEGICQYSKKKISKSEASRDHVVPRSKGGTNDISNIVLSSKEINSRKGDQLNSACGLPEVVPIIPKQLPMKDVLVNHKKVPEWDWFLKKRG
jgi:5-methylcytosine-specific restriction endonuclease McrA